MNVGGKSRERELAQPPGLFTVGPSAGRPGFSLVGPPRALALTWAESTSRDSTK